MTDGFVAYKGTKFGEGAQYRSLFDGIATDKEREERRQERKQNRTGFKSIGEGVTWGAWDNFKAPEITYKADISEAEKRMADAQKRVVVKMGYYSALYASSVEVVDNSEKWSFQRMAEPSASVSLWVPGALAYAVSRELMTPINHPMFPFMYVKTVSMSQIGKGTASGHTQTLEKKLTALPSRPPKGWFARKKHCCTEPRTGPPHA